MKNTAGLLDLVPSNAEVHWLQWDGDGPAPVGGYSGDSDSPLWTCQGSRSQLSQAVNAGTAVYLRLVAWFWGDYDYDYDGDAENMYYRSQEESLAGKFAGWIVRYEETDYQGETKEIAVRVGIELPDDVYDHFAAVLAARPDPQPS